MEKIREAFLSVYQYAYKNENIAILDKKRKRRSDRMKYICTVCAYVYDEEQGDPESGIAPGTKWEDVPEDYLCPLCKVGKEYFEKQAE